jgi:uncharacterized membrane protein
VQGGEVGEGWRAAELLRGGIGSWVGTHQEQSARTRYGASFRAPDDPLAIWRYLHHSGADDMLKM